MAQHCLSEGFRVSKRGKTCLSSAFVSSLKGTKVEALLPKQCTLLEYAIASRLNDRFFLRRLS